MIEGIQTTDKLEPMARNWGEEIQDVLDEEANLLAEYVENGRKELTHRVRIAILREIQRLRGLGMRVAMVCQPPVVVVEDIT